MGKQHDPNVEKMILGLGAMAEMAHSFYTAMIKSGASNREASEGMNGFIAAFWHESMEDARRKKQQGESDEEG